MSFSAEIEKWADQTREEMSEIVRQATRMLVERMKRPISAGGNMPINTSYLQNSLEASYSGPVLVDPSRDGSGPPLSGSSVEAAISAFTVGKTLYLGFTAAYAQRQNYGFTGYDSRGRYYSHPGHFFVEAAAAEWPQMIARATAVVSAGGSFR